MGALLDFKVTLTDINCGACAGVYAINERYRSDREKDGGSWNCPYCKTRWGYSDNNENMRLKRELAEERQRKEAALVRANQATAEAAAAERKLKRHLKRTVAGVCPCCNRTFQQLQRHMKTKHPEFKPS